MEAHAGSLAEEGTWRLRMAAKIRKHNRIMTTALSSKTIKSRPRHAPPLAVNGCPVLLAIVLGDSHIPDIISMPSVRLHESAGVWVPQTKRTILQSPRGMGEGEGLVAPFP